MRRYMLYFLVFILTCCAGMAAVVVSRPRRIAIPVPEISVNTSHPATLITETTPEGSFKCTDKLFLFMLEEARRIERRGKGGEEIDHYIHRSGIADCREMFEIDGRPDLNGDGRREFVVRTTTDFWATARSDTRKWVVQETADGYRVVLDAGFIMGIEQEKKRTGNYRVLTSSRHGGAEEFVTAWHTYRNGAYQVSKCESYRLYEDKVRREKLSYCEVVR